MSIDFAIILNTMMLDWTLPITSEEYEAVRKMARLSRKISIVSTLFTVMVTTAGAVSQVISMLPT